ncbi:hypothetical protein FACS1894172_07740 [Spirochaetia bacterium]|nr:hypothetical protein FACS1894164_06180 [Spirochaetia bacterium]GHU31957.1 hypothetical protein FACS1894172_07740 [Spirochaetia bacterium]
MVEFKKGDTIHIEGSVDGKIVEELGRGTQGIAYKLMLRDRLYALKWFTSKGILDNAAFKENLRKNIEERKSPDSRFLWPLYMTAEQNGAYGYVMDLKPSEYSKFPAILNCVPSARFPSWDEQIVAALNLVSAFRALHLNGLSYQDMNDGSFFINVKTGDIKICDTDNVTSGGEANSSGVKGTPGYMAPEIIAKQEHPSTETDFHSLAVVLFKLFVHHHPLEGKRLADGDGLADPTVLHGTDPVFIFDPDNTSNRPTLEEQENPRNIWPGLPEYIQNLFIQAFGEGLKSPTRRPTELEWQKALLRFRDEDVVNDTHDAARFLIGDYSIALIAGKELYRYHVEPKADFLNINFSSSIGKIVSNKTTGRIALLNNSGEAWMFTAPDGTKGKVETGQVIEVKCGTELTVNGVIGHLAFQLNTDKYNLTLSPGVKLYAYHTNLNGTDRKTVTGKVVARKDNPQKWALLNLSDTTWRFRSAWDEEGEVAKDQVVSLARGCVINFGDISGTIAG